MAAPSANIVFFVTFVITLSCSCYAPVAALAVPETGEVAFPSQSFLPNIPILSPILNPIISPILNPIISPILSPIFPPSPGTQPNINNIFPLTANITFGIGLSVGGLLPNFTLPNATLPIITFPNVTLPNTTLPNGTILPVAINVTISIPGLATFQLGANLLSNGLLLGLLQVVGSAGNTVLGLPLFALI